MGPAGAPGPRCRTTRAASSWWHSSTRWASGPLCSSSACRCGLTLLTFLGAFVPLFGATVSGAVAVLVTLVTNGLGDAVIVVVVVLVVQQIEGNLLQPLIVGRALRVHPAAVLVAVTAGTLLWSLAGALLAVPLVAVTYQVGEYVQHHPAATAGGARSAPGPACEDGRPGP